jgi:pSer/pThr/pTyr-binding forkhead associated (FHA) protein
MAKLVLSSGGAIVHQCFLDQERLSVGRQPDNQVVIDDPTVSERHAAIIPIGNDHILEDLQSGSGTFVNGTRVSRHILQHGDVIKLGAFYLRYLNPRASADRDLERTMLITGLQARLNAVRQGPGPAPEEARVPSARHARVHFPKGRIGTMAGQRTGEVIPLDRVVATFGTRGNQLAVITRRPHGYFITHVEGRRYPRVNGQPIGKDAHALRNGDVIDVADERLQFFLE